MKLEEHVARLTKSIESTRMWEEALKQAQEKLGEARQETEAARQAMFGDYPELQGTPSPTVVIPESGDPDEGAPDLGAGPMIFRERE